MPPAAPNPFRPRRLAWRLGFAAVAVVSVFAVLSMTSSRPTTLGLHGGRLAPCPDTPNCVSSLAERPSQAVLPFVLDRPVAEAKAMMKQALTALPRTQLIREEANYLHFEFRSFLFRFVDDVELHFDEATKVIHIRSASRVGHSDLGVNRRRVEVIRARLPAAMQGPQSWEHGRPRP